MYLTVLHQTYDVLYTTNSLSQLTPQMSRFSIDLVTP